LLFHRNRGFSKTVKAANGIERRAAETLKAFLGTIPQLSLAHMSFIGESGQADNGVDIVAETEFAGRPMRLVVEVKSNGQPRMAHQAAYQLKRYLGQSGQEGVPMFMAPYLSEQSQAACREEGIAYLDFEGNARIAFDTVFIDRQVEGKPDPERRALRSLFKPKSARILRVLLNEPARAWRVTELAEAAKVSLGLVSTIGTALRDREWADQSDQGLYVKDPSGLLDEWARNYEPPKGEEVRLYTHLHGKALSERLRDLEGKEGRVALASFSAADWYAPFVRQSSSYFYADEKGLGALQTLLSLSSPAKGANIVVRVPDEDGVLDDARVAAPGIVATSPVQTYLDLMAGGERGIEGAEHLKDQLLRWPS
jgi:hypothetical protein